MERKEIYFANIVVLNKNKKQTINKVVYKEEDGFYRNIRVLRKNGIKEDFVKVVSFEIIHSMGFDNITTESMSFNKSDEKRNNITGAYE